MSDRVPRGATYAEIVRRDKTSEGTELIKTKLALTEMTELVTMALEKLKKFELLNSIEPAETESLLWHRQQKILKDLESKQ